MCVIVGIMPNLYIISGPNGAGKTTASMQILKDWLKCDTFCNADEIAKGLNPLNPESSSIQAAKILLTRMDTLMKSGADFAVETTLATKMYSNLIRRAHENGYSVMLIFLWLNMPSLAVERVKLRVLSGGHNIPEESIRRRYVQGIVNLFDRYLPLVDYWIVVDNSYSPVEIVVEGGREITTKIHNKTKLNQIIDIYERNRGKGTEG